MKVNTTVRKAGLLRLVTYRAQGSSVFRKRLVLELRGKIEESLQDLVGEEHGKLLQGGGFSFRNTQMPVTVDLTSDDLKLLVEAFSRVAWNPENITEGLERIVWEVEDELPEWVKEAEAEEKWEALPAAQKAKQERKLLAAEKKRKAKEKKRKPKVKEEVPGAEETS